METEIMAQELNEYFASIFFQEKILPNLVAEELLEN